MLAIPTAEHEAAFAKWRDRDRLELQTCRPVIDGKRVVSRKEVVTWVLLIDQIKEPAGKFTYFDLNPRNRSAEFGYVVNPAWRRKGIGTLLLQLAIDRLFSTTNLNKLYCQTGAFNRPSIRLLEKLGFHRDGVLREHHELDGKLWDDYIYSILRHEWESSP